MKVLCEYTPCGPHYVRTGWGRVFAALGHEFGFWKPEKKSAFDVFSENEPDIFLGTTYGVDRAIFKNIASRPNLKVALFASAWGPLADSIDKQKYPIVVATDNEKRIIERLKKETGKPDFVFIHVTDKYLDATMSGWRSIGVEPIGILNAADTFDYLGGTFREELACDVGFVGGYWGYKARNLDKYMLPLCQPDAGFKVKVFGNQPWPVPQYMGLLEDSWAKDLFKSATVCPSVSEPHSTDFGFDVIERPFKVMAAGGFCVSDYVDEASEVFTGGELIRCKTPTEFIDTIRYFVAHPEDREQWINAGRRKVLMEHTYFDRVAKMTDMFGLTQESARILKLKGELLKGKL